MPTMRWPDLFFPVRYFQRERPSIEHQKIDMPPIDDAKALLTKEFPNKLLTFKEYPELQYTISAKVEVYEGTIFLGRATLREIDGKYVWRLFV